MKTSLTVALDETDLVELDRRIVRRGTGQSREAAATEILCAALRPGSDRPQDEGLRPDELNASNDS